MTAPDSSLREPPGRFEAFLSYLRTHQRPLLAGALLIVVASLVGLWFALTWDLPQVSQIRRFTPAERLTIKAMDGSTVFTSGNGPVQQVKYKQIPPQLIKAIVATEDRRFYDHQGIDFRGIVRAIVRDAEAGELREGGSTITQQLARNLFLTRERTFWRKLREIILAARIEQELSKEEILTLYLNQIYFGSGAYGIADAARTYFSKTPDRLTLVESALLAGLPQAPSRYSPLVNKTLARKRRDSVLKNLVEVGSLKQTEFEALRNKPVVVRPAPREERTRAAYFTSYIESQLPELLGTANLPGALTVETTLDPAMQAEAQKTLSTALAGYRGRRVSQGALITLDPTTGEIRAMAGGSDFSKSQFNRAVQALRQPGSTFKAFVYTAAIEAGIRPDEVFVDQPTRFGSYEVKNYDRRYYGQMTLVDALKESRNTIAVQVFARVGEDKVVDTARRMGIKSKLQPGAAMALGASELTLLELTSAYGTLANGGTRIEPMAIRRIVGKQGQVLYTAVPKSTPALAPEVAATMSRMLEQVILNGTGKRAFIDRPAAGKTGTTENYRDLLFVGYTPQLVTGVWLGNDNNSPTRGSSSLAAGLWGQYMTKVVKNFPPANFPNIERTEPVEASPPMGEEIPAPDPTPDASPAEEPVSGDEPTEGEINCYTGERGELVCSNRAGEARVEPPPAVGGPDDPWRNSDDRFENTGEGRQERRQRLERLRDRSDSAGTAGQGERPRGGGDDTNDNDEDG